MEKPFSIFRVRISFLLLFASSQNDVRMPDERAKKEKKEKEPKIMFLLFRIFLQPLRMKDTAREIFSCEPRIMIWTGRRHRAWTLLELLFESYRSVKHSQYTSFLSISFGSLITNYFGILSEVISPQQKYKA